MLPATEWGWFVDQAHGDYDHLVVGSSLPWLMPPAIHHLEAWNERTADSPRPRTAARAERIRRAFDLEHWAAFGRSFDAMGELFRRLGEAGSGRTVGAGPAYAAPATISVLSGDVHHSYVARAGLAGVPIHQLTCSPVHNRVPLAMRAVFAVAWTGAAAAALRSVDRLVTRERTRIGWTKLAGPHFGTAVSTLLHSGRSAGVVVEGTDAAGRLSALARVALTEADQQPEVRP
jgi:hypothetical protein